MSISISESSMIPTLVFSEWTSTSSSLELEREFPRESTPEENSANSKELPPKTPSNGSPRSALEPSSEQISGSIKIEIEITFDHEFGIYLFFIRIQNFINIPYKKLKVQNKKTSSIFFS